MRYDKLIQPAFSISAAATTLGAILLNVSPTVYAGLIGIGLSLVVLLLMKQNSSVAYLISRDWIVITGLLFLIAFGYVFIRSPSVNSVTFQSWLTACILAELFLKLVLYVVRRKTSNRS